MDWNTIILNVLSHMVCCMFIYTQYLTQSDMKRLIAFMAFLFGLLIVPEFLSLSAPMGILKVAVQALFMIGVSVLVIGGFDKKILIVTFSGAVFSTPGNIIGSVMFLYIPDTVNYFLRLALVLLVSLAIHALVMVIGIFYVGRRLKDIYLDKEFPWVAFFLVPLTFYCSIYSLRVYPENFSEDPLNMVAAVFVSLLCISSYFLAIKIMDYQKNNTTLFYSNQEYEILIGQMKTRVELINQKEKDAAILRHNDRHLMNLLRQLIADGEYEMAVEVLESHIDDVESTAVRSYCKNVVVNSVLEFAVKACEKKGIPINIQADIPDRLSVSDMELAMVIANLLENATRAAAMCKKDPKVSFIALKKGDKIIIEVSNSFVGKIHYDEKDHIPLSSRGEGHGLGMQSIMIFTEKNGAIFDCSDKDGIFIVRMLIQDT